MGIVFGVTGTKGPLYLVLQNNPLYEIRQYEAYVTATVTMDEGNGFTVLADYIGVFGNPANEVSKQIDMTHPVIIENQKIDMTSPVVIEKNVMKFVLPVRYSKIEDVPKPTNSKVTLKEVPAQYIASIQFSGWYSEALGKTNLEKLKKALQHDGYLPPSSSNESSKEMDIDWCVAQYHPPFTLPFLRLNEVWIKLDPSYSPALKTLLTKRHENCNKHPDL
jgi:hypothetical protein